MGSLIGQSIGEYRIEQLLAEGINASVYRAHQSLMERDVALKITDHYITDEPYFTRRFEFAVQLLVRVSHQSIVKVLDYGSYDLGRIYVVMELMTGGNLSDRIQQQPLAIGTTARMLNQVASALDYLHQQNVILRDLKPQHMLLDALDNIALTGFTSSKIASNTTPLKQGGTAIGIVIGTPAYMAPEQALGKDVDSRADIYTLGICLFKMLTGRLPFTAVTPMATLLAQIHNLPPLASAIRGDLPPGVDHVIGRALAKEPEARFRTASEMAAAFRAALD